MAFRGCPRAKVTPGRGIGCQKMALSEITVRRQQSTGAFRADGSATGAGFQRPGAAAGQPSTLHRAAPRRDASECVFLSISAGRGLLGRNLEPCRRWRAGARQARRGPRRPGRRPLAVPAGRPVSGQLSAEIREPKRNPREARLRNSPDTRHAACSVHRSGRSWS